MGLPGLGGALGGSVWGGICHSVPWVASIHETGSIFGREDFQTGRTVGAVTDDHPI